MSYRVEMSKSARAGCQATECKKAGIKIEKDVLRLGVWVPYEDRGSWKWRHWGCVTGKTIENLRTKLSIGGPGSDGYDWDALDGYAGEDDKSSLENYPDMQEKVRRVVTQGFVDEEDWNGDPEMNVLGAIGLRTSTTKKQMRKDDIERVHEISELKDTVQSLRDEVTALKASGGKTTKLEKQLKIVEEALNEKEGENPTQSTPSKKKVVAKKRGRDDGDVEDEEKPKKKRAPAKKKAKKEESSDEEDVKPVKKSRAKKVKDESEDEEEEVMPVKKSRGKLKTEEGADEDIKPAPVKKARGKKVKVEDGEGEDVKPPPAKKARGKKAVKTEDQEDGEDTKDVPVKNEVQDEAESAPTFTEPEPAKRGRGKKAAIKQEVKDEADEDEDENSIVQSPKGKKSKTKVKKGGVTKKEESTEDEDEAMIDVPTSQPDGGVKGENGEEVEEEKVGKGKSKKGGAKKAAANLSTRGSRSRTASKA